VKVLFVSNLFPNTHEPSRGLFNLPLVTAISQFAKVRVVAPVAWFPIPGKYAPPSPVPAYEEVYGLESKVHSLPIPVYHPCQFYLPKICRPVNPLLFAWSLYPLVKRIRAEYPFDIIHVDWAYPDGCGVAKIARWLDVPFVISVAGSDANVYMTWLIRRWQIRRMMRQSGSVITRSQALCDVLKSNGVPALKIRTIYNGVDCDLYRPFPRDEVLRSLGIAAGEPTAIYVGRLSPEKRVEDLLTAVAILSRTQNRKVRLLVVGDGPLRSPLETMATELGIAAHVHWLGAQPPSAVARLISAANVLCLGSLREGVPNVLMEAMACGVPVVATRVGGIPEVVPDFAGILVPPSNAEKFATGIATALDRVWLPEKVRNHAMKFTWLECGCGFHQIFQAAVAGHKHNS
jgi:glycosyltransferase involved in cell wall biosynthesis